MNCLATERVYAACRTANNSHRDFPVHFEAWDVWETQSADTKMLSAVYRDGSSVVFRQCALSMYTLVALCCKQFVSSSSFVLSFVISTSAGCYCVFRGKVIGGGQYGCHHAVCSTSWPQWVGTLPHAVHEHTQTRDSWITSTKPRHHSWKLAARFSQTLLSSCPIHVIAAIT